MYRLVLKGKAPSLNEWLSGTHWRKKAASKKEWEETIFWALKEAKLPKLSPPITINATIFNRRPKDTDNQIIIVKFLCDALVKGGYLESDDYRHIPTIILNSKKGTEDKTVILLQN